MLLVVAPYSPIGSPSPNLGAARKLENVIKVLSSIDSHIVLLNTAHNHCNTNWFSQDEVSIDGTQVLQITLPTLRWRILGKFFNLLHVSLAISRVLKIGVPKLVWLYNGYAFESLAGLKIKKRLSIPVMLEFEDWHYARSRGFNFKPFIDHYFWSQLVPHLELCFCVNDNLLRKCPLPASKLALLPGLIANSFRDIHINHPPFKGNSSKTVIGYMGGLSVEKGAFDLYNAISTLPSGVEFYVTGSGSLADSFKQLSSEHPNILKFEGSVSSARLMQIYEKCDVVINPHHVTEELLNGVFPSKVIEALGSGRLVASTELPREGLQDALQGICFIEQGVKGILDAVTNLPYFYQVNSNAVREGAVCAFDRFSQNALEKRIRQHLNF